MDGEEIEAVKGAGNRRAERRGGHDVHPKGTREMEKTGLSRLSAAVVFIVLGSLAGGALLLLAEGDSSAQAPPRPSVAYFDSTTDTIQASGQTVIGTASTYEAVVLFPSDGGARGNLFNEHAAFQEDKLLEAGPSGIGGFNFGAGSRVLSTNSVTLSQDVWHHVAYVYDGSQERLYLDGEREVSRPAGGDVADSDGLGHIGAIFRDGSVRSSFVGYMDSIRISNTARYSGDSFTAPTGDLASDANTLLLYNFAEEAGSTTVADGSPNGRTGTLGAGFSGATSPELGAIVVLPTNSAPTITPLKPEPDSKIKKLKPEIVAIVEDAETELTKADIKLSVDGKKIRSFTYDAQSDKLKHRVESRLDPGEHTVEVAATDAQGISTTEEWSFKVKKK